MKLVEFEVTNFQSVLSSNTVGVDDITCLVGKNEAGKTSLLKALYRLNPIRKEDANFNVTDDYPRSSVADYEDDIANNRIGPSPVVKASYSLDENDIKAVSDILGSDFLTSKTVSITKYYDNSRGSCWDPGW